MFHPIRGHHGSGNLYHTHYTTPEILPRHYQHGHLHGHASTINTSDGSCTLHEYQTPGTAGASTEKHRHPYQLNLQDKGQHPAHRQHGLSNTAHEINTDVRPKPPKPGCPYHNNNPRDALRRTHTHPHPHTGLPQHMTNGHDQREHSPLYHGNHIDQPRARSQIIPPAPTRQNQHHHHHAHDPAPVESQVHRFHAYPHMYFAHGALDPGSSQHDHEEDAHPKESPPDRSKPRVGIREEDLMWGYGPPLPILTVHRRKNNRRRRKS